VAFDDNWNDELELRVFVHNKKVTAISQYVWSCPGYFSKQSDPKLIEIAAKVIDYIQGEIIITLSGSIGDSFVADLYYDDVLDKLRVIEFNCFGYWLAAGSALFHWINDKKILYGTDAVTFRVCRNNL